MRRTSPLSSALIGSFALAAALGLACASGSQTAKSSPCLDRCTNIQSPLDRSTCELECSRVATPASAVATAPTPTPPAATPAPAPTPTQPTPPVVATPQPPRPQPVAQPQPPRPVTPTPAPVAVGPTYGELQQQRLVCESQCDNEASNSDRATCRVQCAQITNQPYRAVGSSGGTPTYVTPPGTPPPSYGTPQPTPTDPQAIASCLSTCNDPSTPETDRATCRLQCNANGSVLPPPSSYYVLGGTPPSDAEQRAAIIRSSSGTAGTTAPRPPAATPTAQQQQKFAACAATAQTCNTSCNTQLSPCTAGCDQGKMSSTDRATCKLTCESSAEVCRDDCRIKEGSCRSKP